MSNRRTGDIVKRGYETNSHRKAKYKSWKTVGILENEICVCVGTAAIKITHAWEW